MNIVRLYRLVLTGFVLFFVINTSTADDLLEIYQAALENDPQFKTDTFVFEAEKQGAKIARADLLPDISFTASTGRQRNELESTADFIIEGTATYDSHRFGVNLNQPLFDRSKFLNYRQSKQEVERAGLLYKRSKQDLIIKVAERYFTVLAAEDNLELSKAEKKAVFRQLELAQNRLEVGLGTVIDLYDAEARYGLTEVQEIEAINLLDDAYQALWELIGTTVTDLNTLDLDSPMLEPVPNQVEPWIQRSHAGNLDLLTAQLSQEISKSQLDKTKSGHLPTLNLVMSHISLEDEGSISGPGLERKGSEAMLQLQIPIYKGGAITSSSRDALYRYQAAQSETESAERFVSRVSRSTFLQVVASIRQAAALDQAVVASENALEGKEQGFEAGLNTNLDVLDAQRDVFETKRDYLKARYQYILNRLTLRQITGELNEGHLQKVNTWLN